MLLYRGTLPDRHLRAAVRVALRAHGLTVSRTDLDQLINEHGRLGTRLRDQAFPRHFPEFFGAADYRAVAEADPGLWDRLPLMAALGHRQAAVLHGLAAADPALVADATLLGAFFNTAIAVLDYLIDECGQGAVLFDLLSPAIVRAIFEAGDQAQTGLALAGGRLTDPRLRLLFALVAGCAAGGRALVRRTQNSPAWRALGEVIARLYAAERAASLAGASVPADRQDLSAALETKSAQPSLALLWIATLASPRPEPTPQARRAAQTLGRIFCRVDDVVDLFTDCRRGAPSTVTLQLADVLAARGRTWASDGDVYDLVDPVAAELVELLAPTAFGPDAPAAVQEFARLTVAGWVGWGTEDGGPALPVPAPAPPEGTTRQAVGAAVERVLAAQRDGFQEAAHHLHFPRLSRQNETHPALLSFRAVALDALLDAAEAGLPVPPQVLNAEAMTILRMKHRAVRGGWNYVPEVPELPPDADDVGQVLQVLCRLGGPALAATCDDGIRLLLDAQLPDGGLNTWILDPRGRSAADAAVRDYLPVMGGWGVHPEVVANMMYGLLLYDPIRFREPLERAAAYLLRVQEPQGFWPSHWYAGPYYGTFRALWALGPLTPGDPALERARSFLLAGQHPDGSWGAGAGDCLSTALALLALAAPNVPTDGAAARRGTAYLVRTQAGDGGWPADTWISFASVDGQVTYGSRTMTTAFALKALLLTPLAT